MLVKEHKSNTYVKLFWNQATGLGIVVKDFFLFLTPTAILFSTAEPFWVILVKGMRNFSVKYYEIGILFSGAEPFEQFG